MKRLFPLFLPAKASPMKYISLILVLLIVAFSCKKSDEEENKNLTDDEKIQQYLDENSINATKHESGLYYTIEDPGSGGSPDQNSIVEVRYKGYLLDGTVFDETSGSSTVSFSLSILIEGWQIGIPLMQKGGSGTFFLPSSLGYGNNQVGDIPPNSVLIFEIELVDFQ
jgi:FKBP-type peptidyl-prolyl cis-trans isomerase FkpA